MIIVLSCFIGIGGLYWFSERLGKRFEREGQHANRLFSYILADKETKSTIEQSHIQQSVSSFVGSITSVLALTRAFGFLFAALTLAVSTALLIAALMQVDRIDQQNDKIDRQNQLIVVQAQLSEAERRASLNFELSSILDRITALSSNENECINLDPVLRGRIISLSKSLRPYRYIDVDKAPTNPALGVSLSDVPSSPERGQLLLSLFHANVCESLNEAVFSSADLIGANLSGGRFGQVQLAGAFLAEARITQTDFSAATLILSDLSQIEAIEANFSGANLVSATMTDGSYFGADFSNVQLLQANLSNSDFSNADFSGANFSKTDISGAIFAYPEGGMPNWGIEERPVLLSQEQIDEACHREGNPPSLPDEFLLPPICDANSVLLPSSEDANTAPK